MFVIRLKSPFPVAGLSDWRLTSHCSISAAPRFTAVTEHDSPAPPLARLHESCRKAEILAPGLVPSEPLDFRAPVSELLVQVTLPSSFSKRLVFPVAKAPAIFSPAS